jgi:hypothetical protein
MLHRHKLCTNKVYGPHPGLQVTIGTAFGMMIPFLMARHWLRPYILGFLRR